MIKNTLKKVLGLAALPLQFIGLFLLAMRSSIWLWGLANGVRIKFRFRWLIPYLLVAPIEGAIEWLWGKEFEHRPSEWLWPKAVEITLCRF